MQLELRAAIERSERDAHIVVPRITRMFLAFLLAWLPALLVKHGLDERLEQQLLRRWFVARGTIDMPQTVSIVRLDKPAYDILNVPTGMMYPRTKLAEIIDAISEGEPKLIVLDLLFQGEWQDAEGDRKLAAALSRSKSIIGRSAREYSEPTLSGETVVKRRLLQPAPLFAQAAKQVAFMNVARDHDGRVRGISLSSERGFRSDANVPLLAPLREFVSPELVEPGPFDFINFYGGPSTILSLSAARLLSPDDMVDPAYFKGRVVLIGVYSDAAVGLDGRSDVFMTSYSDELMAGVEIHATIVANLLDKAWIRHSPEPWARLAGTFWTLIVSYFILGAGMSGTPLLVFAASAVWLCASYYAFSELFYFVPGAALCILVVPLAGLLRGSFLFYRYWAKAKTA